MEHKRYVVAINTDLDNAEAYNKSPVSVFDIAYHGENCILPNNQFLTHNGKVFNIWNSYDAESKAKRRRAKLNLIAGIDTEMELTPSQRRSLKI